jgi:hypothetical protein
MSDRVIKHPTRREQRMHAAIRANRLRVEPIGSAGALLVFGPGVYILVSSLRHLSEWELQPVRSHSAPRDHDGIGT